MPITVAALCEALPVTLRSVEPAHPPRTPVTGVHVSDLLDPRPFLDGGELLLTTGLSVREEDVEGYFARLAAHGASGVGLGVGLTHETVPEAWRAAARRHGLALLDVPEEARFQDVIREFWSQMGAGRADELRAAMGAVHALVRASVGDDPEQALVRALANALGGWAAGIAPDGTLQRVHPRSKEREATRVAHEVGRMRLDGPYAAASFRSEGDDVMVHSVDGSGPTPSRLVVGRPPPMPPHARHLVLTACALSSMREQYSRTPRVLQAAAPAVVGTLLRRGHLDAAADLARDWQRPIPVSVRIAVVEGPAESDLDAAAASTAGFVAPGEPAVLIVPTTGAVEVITHLRRLVHGCPDDTGRGVVTRAAGWAEIPSVLVRAEEAFARTEPGTFRDLGETRTVPPENDPPGLAELAGYRRADLVGTLAAYLRHRGRLEPAAAELGLHRNSMRHRVGIIREVLEVDIEDPDVAARWWLALRARGLA